MNNAMHFVHNKDGKNSIIRNLTVEEYEAKQPGLHLSLEHSDATKPLKYSLD